MRTIVRAAATLAALSLTLPLPAGEKGTVVDLDGLKSATPPAWKHQEIDPKLKQFRLYQFIVPKADGDKEDAEVVISQLKGASGSTEQNITRWKQMFAPPPGKTLDEVAKVENQKVGDAKLTYLDVSGTYLFKPPFNPNAKPQLKDNYRMLGVIFETKEGPSYIRLTGPARTVEQNKKAFDDWLKAFK
jgi:hypothetical protein